MSCRRSAVAAAAFLLAALSLQAQSGAPERAASVGQPTPCASANTQMEMTQCSAEQYRKSDARLNAVYRQVLDSIEKALTQARRGNDAAQIKFLGTQSQNLKLAELSWVRYRDLHCKANEQIYEGGSMQSMVVSDCLKLITDHRIDEIKQAYERVDRKLE